LLYLKRRERKTKALDTCELWRFCVKMDEINKYIWGKQRAIKKKGLLWFEPPGDATAFSLA